MSNDFNKKIGNRISCLRNRFHYTQDIVSEIIGISRSSLSQIENGNRPISLEEAVKLADLFRLDLNNFLTEQMVIDRPFTFEDVLLLIDQDAWFRLKNAHNIFKITTVNLVDEWFVYAKTIYNIEEFIQKFEYTFDRETYYKMDSSDEN